MPVKLTFTLAVLLWRVALTESGEYSKNKVQENNKRRISGLMEERYRLQRVTVQIIQGDTARWITSGH